ncbi:response regulator transcription factor [Streptomyces coelicoflavus]|uniref:response regulator transcription factor n=1 Tax=Streptomyces coelicoflavus TaxID=285562 RepID=UPI003679CE0C
MAEPNNMDTRVRNHFPSSEAHSTHAPRGELAHTTWRADELRSGTGAQSAEAPSWTQEAARASLLTPREIEVFFLLGAGSSNRSIATKLGITERTVKAHVARIMNKVGVESRLQAGLVAYAYQLTAQEPQQSERGNSENVHALGQMVGGEDETSGTQCPVGRQECPANPAPEGPALRGSGPIEPFAREVTTNRMLNGA